MRKVGTKIILKTLFDDLDEKKLYVMTINDFNAKRSLDQNAYYWSLLDQYADWGDEDKMVLHNQMLQHYGQNTGYTANIPIGVDTWKMSDMHLIPYEQTETEQHCYIFRGTHTYTTKEMTALIKGLINEIKGSGAPIETMTPVEMAQLWAIQN